MDPCDPADHTLVLMLADIYCVLLVACAEAKPGVASARHREGVKATPVC
jgi:hypothetical protein